MTDKQLLSLAWTVKQQECAKLLAIGFSQTSAADRMAVPLRTVQSWWAKREYREFVQALHATAGTTVAPAMENLLLQAVDIERQVFSGEVEVGDGRYKAAQRRIDQFLERMALSPTSVPLPLSDPSGESSTANLPRLPARSAD